MKTKLITLALIITTLGLTGCNTTTSQSASIKQLAEKGVTAQQLLGGKIGTQIAATGRTTTLQDSDKQSKLVTNDERAYLNWKKANRS